jgi:hypothetical protein
LHKRLEVGNALTITDVTFYPNPVETGTDLQFGLNLMANSPVRLSEASLLLHALEGPRVGIVDLRPAGFPFSLRAGEILRIEGRLRSIPLVENYYRINAWIDSGAFVGELADLAQLRVAPASGSHAYTPYPPEVRGWIEFNCELSSRKHQRSGAMTAVT